MWEKKPKKNEAVGVEIEDEMTWEDSVLFCLKSIEKRLKTIEGRIDDLEKVYETKKDAEIEKLRDEVRTHTHYAQSLLGRLLDKDFSLRPSSSSSSSSSSRSGALIPSGIDMKAKPKGPLP